MSYGSIDPWDTLGGYGKILCPMSDDPAAKIRSD